ncbi:type I-B CRISPR-associated protein Cas7/Cst2/DevR [bacterium]|nr:type I-B CRISPR-associated protein Cas7/Cst2/DevR [bacterium]
MKTNSITITYLSKVSFASLNGSDKDVDNINPIKKVTLSNGEELPYVSSQAIRHALREKLEEMGETLSIVDEASAKKGAPKTACNPVQYIDDDLFGFMDAAASGTATRTSPIRVESLLALSKYQGDLDFGTNFMGKEKGIQPNIFETEIHSGLYRGTILIELDRIGCGDGFNENPEIENTEKARRVKAFIDAFANLWSSGRQTRFLADISPKFIAAAYMKTKNPIFLESVNISDDGKINIEELKTVTEDYSDFIEDSVFAVQKSVFSKDENVKNLKDGWDTIKSWIDEYYKEEQNK